MGPDKFRKYSGFAALGAAPVALFSASPAQAEGLVFSQWMAATPFTVALGAAGFGVLAALILRRRLRDARIVTDRAAGQVAALRAQVDQYEALLSGAPELTLIWPGAGARPRVFGQAPQVLPLGRPAETVLNFSTWLTEADSPRLAQAVEALRIEGRPLDLTVATRDGRPVRAQGTAIGDATALRLRAISEATEAPPRAEPALLDGLPEPAFLRDSSRRLVYANPAYYTLARRLGRRSTDAQPADFPELAGRRAEKATQLELGEAGEFALLEVPLRDGYSAGILRPEPPKAQAPAPLDRTGGHLAAVIDALSIPVAIFDGNRELVQFNRAYAQLWGLDPDWLRPGLDERAILDRLRTESKLPSDPDYHAWRARHLAASYSLKAPRESDPWHLPDGRTINVIAAPASPTGGVIYVFEDITRNLELESRNKALLDVQRSTINSLTEAVAVFGTNGRLTLSNPRLSAIWKLPLNELGNNPHIDQVAAASARGLPQDGAVIWRDLKRAIIDLNPHRTDTRGRINRADGRLLDYNIVRLPDGQTMMTFLDVTESAKYGLVLKERNEALITADRLKDAFVQNVSYELRSPLTNIIGFSDLLASDAVGPLNERQRAYTDYIRASSETLGVLIDNILDLATVDAGIAELRPQRVEVAALVEKARAGLAATFPKVDGQAPLNLVIDVPKNLPPLTADGTRLVQILYNLLSSAARFSEPGAAIRLAVMTRGERMLFIVEDEGTAMPEEIRAAMERGSDPSVAGRQRGAGLGLAIVRAFVSLHGGTVTVERREPHGNRVVVSLPLEIGAAGAGAAE